MDPIIIEAETGAIQLGARDRLLPWESLAAVEPRVAHLLRHRKDFGTGYEWLYLQDLSFGGQPASLALCFAHRRLEMANVSVSLPGARDGWPGAEEIEAEVAFVRETLRGMVGFNPAKANKAFAWGSVWSEYDPKGDLASSGLRYT